MSEIKGQLLGVLLVLVIFGIVATGMSAVFGNLEDTVETTVDTAIKEAEDTTYTY